MADDPWADFRKPPAAVAPPVDEWADFRRPPATTQQPSVAADVAKSGGTGLVRGVLGALGTIPAAVDAAHGAFDRYVLDPVLGAIPDQNKAAQVDVTPSGLEKKLTAYTGPLHEPQTTAGKYAETIGEFAPSALVGPGGAARKAAEVVLPAIASEAAGQATAGSPLEPYARLAGGLAAGGVTGMAAARTSAPERMVVRATAGQDASVFQLAQALQDRAATLGVPLSGAEAVQQVTQGGTKLGDLQRVIEGSTEGGAVTAPFYAARPGQVQDATGRVLDQIAPPVANPIGIGPPPGPNPSTLGTQAADAARGAIAATPHGVAAREAVAAIPQTSDLAAGRVIQPSLGNAYDTLAAKRGVQADQDYAAARAAEPGIAIEDLGPTPYTLRSSRQYAYDADQGGYVAAPGRATMRNNPPLAAPNGSGMIQADPRQIRGFINTELSTAKGSVRDALQGARSLLFQGRSLDTSVEGLINARTQLGTMIAGATRSGDGPAARMLQRVRDQFDDTLSDVPEYATARANFEANSRPLDVFDNDPTISKVIEQNDVRSGYARPPEYAPGAILGAGPTTISTFNRVAPQNAKQAFDDYVAREFLNRSSGAGGIDAGRLASTMRDNADVLAQQPGAAARLGAVASTDAAMAPVLASPLGRMADAGTTQAAYGTLLPGAPLAGSEAEAADLARRLASQDRVVVPSLVRQHLADAADAASRNLQSGPAQYAGANFANAIAGTPQQRQNLEAVMGAAGVRSDLSALAEALQATGMRKQPGSATEFNRQMAADLARPGALAEAGRTVATGGAYALPLMAKLGDKLNQAYLGRNAGRLADLFVAPDSATQLGTIAARGAESPIAALFARSVLQAPAEVRTQ